jgi:hypothetical protein
MPGSKGKVPSIRTLCKQYHSKELQCVLANFCTGQIYKN